MFLGRTIRETVEDGISNRGELQGSFLTAIQLEFSTIPPYLCAEWSINNDTSDVEDMIQGVVFQEMLHFGLACNMYTATVTDGDPSLKDKIATPNFVLTYPTNGLPGGVHPGLVVSLLPIGDQSLQTFMSIEYPDMPIVVLQQPASPPAPTPPTPPTIGQFYQAIATGFTTVFPTGNLPSYPSPSPNQVVTEVDSDLTSDKLFAVNCVADALTAIGVITDQGEGTSQSADQVSNPQDLAHYYTFAQIYYSKKIVPVGSGFEYSDKATDVVNRPTVFNFAPEPSAPGQQTFINDFSKLMTQLEACWTSGGDIDTAEGTMRSLRRDGVSLIKAGFTPEFIFQ